MENSEIMELEYQTKEAAEKATIVVHGDLDNETAGEALRKAFNQMFEKGHRTVVLDLQGVQIINSYGIGKILMCYKRIKAEDGVLMVKPLNGFVKETFELLMLDSMFPIDTE